MAENDYVGESRKVIARAVDEAAKRGATAVEAEHILLALSEDTGAVADALAEFGLDHDGIERMLRDERAASLAAVGITTVDEASLVSSPRRSRPTWGASAREAILRGSKLGHRDRQRVRVVDLAVGILLAELGTVPRALTIGGVDRDTLVGRIHRLAQTAKR